MGFFSFSKYNNKEKMLLEQYTQVNSVMMNISPSKARKNTEETLDQAIAQSKKEGTYYLPQNLGDIILGDAGVDDLTVKKIVEDIRKKLPRKKKEGIKDEDIRWWWNLGDVECRMMLRQDEVARLALFIQEVQNSTEPTKEKAFDKAMEQVRKFHPIYGDPDDTTHTKGNDRPLPCELKDRVNIYIEKRTKIDPEKYKREIKQSSTFNALIRKEIKAGNL